jgi:hypothetical protein
VNATWPESTLGPFYPYGMQEFDFFVLSPSGTRACINFSQARKALRCAPEQLLAR